MVGVKESLAEFRQRVGRKRRARRKSRKTPLFVEITDKGVNSTVLVQENGKFKKTNQEITAETKKSLEAGKVKLGKNNSIRVSHSDFAPIQAKQVFESQSVQPSQIESLSKKASPQPMIKNLALVDYPSRAVDFVANNGVFGTTNFLKEKFVSGSKAREFKFAVNKGKANNLITPRTETPVDVGRGVFYDPLTFLVSTAVSSVALKKYGGVLQSSKERFFTKKLSLMDSKNLQSFEWNIEPRKRAGYSVVESRSGAVLPETQTQLEPKELGRLKQYTPNGRFEASKQTVLKKPTYEALRLESGTIELREVKRIPSTSNLKPIDTSFEQKTIPTDKYEISVSMGEKNIHAKVSKKGFAIIGKKGQASLLKTIPDNSFEGAEYFKPRKPRFTPSLSSSAISSEPISSFRLGSASGLGLVFTPSVESASLKRVGSASDLKSSITLGVISSSVSDLAQTVGQASDISSISDVKIDSSFKTFFNPVETFSDKTSNFMNTFTPKPFSTSVIPPIKVSFGGSFKSVKKLKSFSFKSQKKGYTPTLTSASLHIKGKRSKFGEVSGLGIRPLQSKKKSIRRF